MVTWSPNLDTGSAKDSKFILTNLKVADNVIIVRSYSKPRPFKTEVTNLNSRKTKTF